MNEPSLHAQARQLAGAGAIAEAEQAYARVLDTAPEDIEALNFLALCAFGARRSAEGFGLLQRAQAVAPDDLETLKNLGAAYQAHGQLEPAQALLLRVLQRQPDHFVARLYFAHGLESQGDPLRALKEYFRAVTTAQRYEFWMTLETTPAGLRDLVLHAMSCIRHGRRSLFDLTMAPLRERYGADALRRIALALDVYLTEVPAAYADPRQCPSFFYIPGLTAQPYWPRRDFPWIEEYEAKFPQIRDELLSVVDAPGGFEPVHRGLDERQLATLLEAAQGKPAWDGYYFHRHGTPYQDNARRCPQTAAALNALPLMRVREHGPEAMFSHLAAGTRIRPHRGVTNARLVVHLGLIVPEGCALDVSGEVRGWGEGECFVFDDTYEHSAWNHGAATRYVLICDVWNPQLDQAEQAAVSDLIGAIGDFNRESAYA